MTPCPAQKLIGIHENSKKRDFFSDCTEHLRSGYTKTALKVLSVDRYGEGEIKRQPGH